MDEALAECLRLTSIDNIYAIEMEDTPAQVYYDLLKARFSPPASATVAKSAQEGVSAVAARTPTIISGMKMKKKKGRKYDS